VTSRLLTPEQVHAVGRAALDNGLNIMSDALTLAALGRQRRAYALGVIAVEEVAKFHRVRQLLRDWSGGLTVVELNKELRPGKGAAVHEERYVEALNYIWSLAPTIPLPAGYTDLRAMARVDLQARERVLYVEVASSGKPMTPEGVDEAEAAQWVTAIGQHLATMARVWSKGLDDALLAVQSP
jgi:AbiV family abortive infection protein